MNKKLKYFAEDQDLLPIVWNSPAKEDSKNDLE
jgi:hypothetical protein